MNTERKSTDASYAGWETADIRILCEGKCRICPFPGANCAKTELEARGKNNAKGNPNKL